MLSFFSLANEKGGDNYMDEDISLFEKAETITISVYRNISEHTPIFVINSDIETSVTDILEEKLKLY